MPSNNTSQTTSEKNESNSDQPTVRLRGIGVSAGIVMGRVLYFGQELESVPERELSQDEVESEVSRFQEALNLSYAQLEEIKEHVAEVLGEKDASIFDAHMMLVADQVIHDEVVSGIREQRRNAEFVYKDVVSRYTEALQDMKDSYVRDRLTDIRDVASRVIRNLQGDEVQEIHQLSSPRVVVAHDLSPSDTASMEHEQVLGFITAIGSRTSHTALVARSSGIPAVVGAKDILKYAVNGDFIIFDGNRGDVIIRPSEEDVSYYEKRMEEQDHWFRNIEKEVALPPITLDGFRVQLSANIELPEEVENIKKSYGVGIGLFRTEYLFVNQSELPTEQEQFEAYRQVTQEILPQSVIIRTVDIGGDKFLSHIQTPNELNPFLGVRAVRFSLAKPDIFMTQLRAILRASAYGKVRVMFPMIGTVEETKSVVAYVKEAQNQLRDEGYDFNRYLDIGIMVELPASAMLADQLAPHVDFFSIGTNDLIQYTLAADRANPEIAYLYQPSHPSIIRLMHNVVRAAYDHGKWVSVCGEMAADPVLIPLIMGMGIHELSMSSVALGPVKRLIRRMRMYEAEEMLQSVFACETSDEVYQLCEQFVQERAPELLPG